MMEITNHLSGLRTGMIGLVIDTYKEVHTGLNQVPGKEAAIEKNTFCTDHLVRTPWWRYYVGGRNLPLWNLNDISPKLDKY